MKKPLILPVTILLLLLSTLSLTGCMYEIPENPHTSVRTIEHDGLTRTYRIHLPPNISSLPSIPLVFVLHGGGGTGENMERTLTLGGFNTLADQEQFIVIYPDGINRNWNDGRTEVNSTAHLNKTDDIGFFETMIINLSEEFPIDSQKIFATGMSNGAMMSFRLAVELPHLFAAVAPVGGSFPTDHPAIHNTTEPISLCIIGGTKDPLVPWNGGLVGTKNNPRGTVFSVPQSVHYWVNHTNCNLIPEHERLPNTNLLDFTRVFKDTYQNGTNNTEIILYTIRGGGHTWPGGYQYFPRILIGRTCKDIDANTIIWEFFKTHSKQ